MELDTLTQTRVAVVEGQHILREALVSMLSNAGFRVVAQYSEVEAFAAHLPDDRPSVAMLGLLLGSDFSPSHRSAPAVVRELHQRHPNVGLLLYADPASADDLERCYLAGAAGYLDRNSARQHSVVEAIHAVARGERVFPVEMLSAALMHAAPPTESDILHAVSPREREVLSFITAGADNLKIATMLKISERTVKAHVTSLYRKMGSENRIQLALEARQLGVRPSPLA